MDVLLLPVGLYELPVAGTVGQDSQLDLRVVRVHKHIALLGHEHLPDQPAQLHPHRDVLQVGFCAADPSRGGDGLIELSVYPAVLPYEDGKPVCVGGFQLSQLAVLQDLRHKGIIRRQLLQHVRRRGVAGLGLLSALQPHLLKEDHAQLLGRVDVEHLPGLLVDLLLQLFDLDGQPVAVVLQLGCLHLHSVPLHVEQGEHKRHLYLLKEPEHPRLLKLIRKDGLGFPGTVGLVAGPSLILLLLVQEKGELLPGHILKGVVTF